MVLMDLEKLHHGLARVMILCKLLVDIIAIHSVIRKNNIQLIYF